MARRAAPTPLIVLTKPANFSLALGLQRITDRREEPVVHRRDRADADALSSRGDQPYWRASGGRLARRTGPAPARLSRDEREEIRAGLELHQDAGLRARRPKSPKLTHGPLVAVVTDWLEQWWSPEQIANFPTIR
jgi:hypothetical protein